MEVDEAKLFIVDDLRDNIQVLGLILKRAGFNFAVSMDSQEAVESIAAEQPDLILLDVSMPVVSGFELCTRLKARQETAHIPVIFLTAMNSSEDVVRGFEVGAVDYITKPFNPKELIARVKTHLELQALRQTSAQQLALLQEAQAELLHLSTVDSLTGLLNHKNFFYELDRAISLAARHATPLSVLMLDLDHFKMINDSMGHQCGDKALVVVADLISSRLRKEDIAGRYGGEEFAIILPHTNMDQALSVAEDLRKHIEMVEIPCNEAFQRLTVSIGVTQLPPGQSHEPLSSMVIEQADKAMYLAKNSGRNRVEAFQGGDG